MPSNARGVFRKKQKEATPEKHKRRRAGWHRRARTRDAEIVASTPPAARPSVEHTVRGVLGA